MTRERRGEEFRKSRRMKNLILRKEDHPKITTIIDLTVKITTRTLLVTKRLSILTLSEIEVWEIGMNRFLIAAIQVTVVDLDLCLQEIVSLVDLNLTWWIGQKDFLQEGLQKDKNSLTDLVTILETDRSGWTKWGKNHSKQGLKATLILEERREIKETDLLLKKDEQLCSK